MDIEKFKIAVKNNISMRATLLSMKMQGDGGNYFYAKKYISQNNIDTSHWIYKSVKGSEKDL